MTYCSLDTHMPYNYFLFYILFSLQSLVLYLMGWTLSHHSRLASVGIVTSTQGHFCFQCVTFCVQCHINASIHSFIHSGNTLWMVCQAISGHHAHKLLHSVTPMGNVTNMFLGRKSKNPEETHADMLTCNTPHRR